MTEHVGDRAYDPLAADAADVSDLAEGVPSLIAAITRSSSGIAGRGAEAIPLLVRHLGQVPDVWGAGMWLVAPDGATLRRRAFRGQHNLPILRKGTLDVQHSILGRIMRGGRPAQIPARDVITEILIPDAAPHALRWVVGVPVTHVEEPLGILGLLTTRHLTSEEIALLTVLGRQVASELAMEQMEAAREEIAYFDTLLAQLETASLQDIEEIREELAEQGYLKPRGGAAARKKKPVRPALLLYTSSENVPIYVGKNNTQNEYLTNRLASPNDTWLHTKDIPGSHVVIRGTGFGNATLEEAAMLAAYYSRGKASSLVPVDYTLIRHVRKPNGAKPGFVIYDHQKTLFVTPDEERIKALPVRTVT